MSHQPERFSPEEPQRHAERQHQGMSLHEEYLHEITGKILGTSGGEPHHQHHHSANGSLEIPPIDRVIGEHARQHHPHHHAHHHQHHHGHMGGGGGAHEAPITPVAPPPEAPPMMPPSSDLPPIAPPSSDLPPYQQPPYPVIPGGDNQNPQPGAPAPGGDNTNPAQGNPNPGGDNTNPAQGNPNPGGDNTHRGGSANPVDHGDPNAFFICQFADKRFNPNGPPSSEDCGPTSLAMIAKYYGASFKDVGTKQQIDAQTADPEALVKGVRGLMTGSDNTKDGTSVGQVENAAKKMGLQTSPVTGMKDLDAALDQGHMVVLSGNPKDYEKDLGLHYGIGGKIYDGGHFITVVGRDGDKYVVNDPATHGGSMELTRAQVDAYIKNEGASGEIGVAVFK